LKGLKPKHISSVNGVRTGDMILRLVPNAETFRVLLRFVRVWAQARGLAGNVYGYLGGVNLALMCAFVCQRYPNAAAATLVLWLFHDLAAWRWPSPVYINTPNRGVEEMWNEATSHDAVPVITPAYPMINSMRSATPSTLRRMIEEFRRGNKLTESVIMGGKNWASLVVPSDFFSKYQRFVRVDISADNEQNFEKWSMTVESRANRLTMSLEKVPGVQAAMAFPKCFGVGDTKCVGSFFIAVVIAKQAVEERQPVDISVPTQRFLTEVMAMPGRAAPWLVEPQIVARKDLPLFVFPDGVRPEPRKPRGKKKLKRNAAE